MKIINKKILLQDETLYTIGETLIDNTVWQQFAENEHFYVPLSYNLHPGTNAVQVNEVATTF
jgi:hypothetical protein